jgi:hypothetical protein
MVKSRGNLSSRVTSEQTSYEMKSYNGSGFSPNGFLFSGSALASDNTKLTMIF